MKSEMQILRFYFVGHMFGSGIINIYALTETAVHCKNTGVKVTPRVLWEFLKGVDLSQHPRCYLNTSVVAV